jgi:hypothetical protein
MRLGLVSQTGFRAKLGLLNWEFGKSRSLNKRTLKNHLDDALVLIHSGEWLRV